MLSTTWLTTKLKADYPHLNFISSKDFYWSSTEQAVYFIPESQNTSTLLHEVAHAVLSHTDYSKDIALIDMERDAWHYAQDVLAPAYGITIKGNVIEDALDTYRDWMHSRSLCPTCGATGIQSKRREYKCLACGQKWRVNEARLCALRRYKLDT